VRLSAIVVAYGKETLVERCLSQLESALERVEGGTELIVVTNGLGAPQLPDRALLVPGAPNLGFAGGVAAGLELARGDWIALVNDDCLVDADALLELLSAGETRKDIGSVAAQVVFADNPGFLNSAGIEIDDLGIARERDVGAPAASLNGQPVEVFGAGATLGLFRRAMLDAVGGIDVSFFAYLEDADLAWRARAAGWRCLLAPQAVGRHHHSSTLGHGSSAKHLLVGRNRVRLLAKNASRRQLRRGLLRIAAYDLLYIAYVAATARTLAPLVGRLRGLAEWRIYRAAGSTGRRDMLLPASPGIRAALGRNRVYTMVARTPPARAPALPSGGGAG
jgi:GT2 family glycosyltransferase